jgi:hypothetical protein
MIRIRESHLAQCSRLRLLPTQANESGRTPTVARIRWSLAGQRLRLICSLMHANGSFEAGYYGGVDLDQTQNCDNRARIGTKVDAKSRVALPIDGNR